MARVFELVVQPKSMVQMKTLREAYGKDKASFNLRVRYMIYKVLDSDEEEHYFKESVNSSEVNISLKQHGVFEFKCKFCAKFHSARLSREVWEEGMEEDVECFTKTNDVDKYINSICFFVKHCT